MRRQALTRRIPLFLTAGFRFFFLAGAIASVVSMLVWILWFALVDAGLPVPFPDFVVVPQHWHAHEMIFGYGVAVLAGFFLTAVPSWTGAPEARSRYIMAVGGLWLLGRAAVWFAAWLPMPVVAVIDLAFLPLLSRRLALNLLKRPKAQNTTLLGLLALIFLANLLVHLEWMGLTADTARGGLWMAVLALCAFIAVIGGRIVPAFTRNVMIRRASRRVSRSRDPMLTGSAYCVLCFLAH